MSKPPTPDEARRRAESLAGPGDTAGGAAMLDEVHAVLTRYVVFPSPQAADAVTLYAATTHAAPELEFATRFVIKSPVKRCGKSRLLDVLEPLIRRPLMTGNISAAALVHSISDDDPPTLLLDEADATFGKALKNDEKAEHLRGIINAGFGRGRPYRRWDVITRRMEECPTFAFVILAGIGAMPDTIEDRAVIIVLQRQAPGQKAAKFRIRRDRPAVEALGDRLGAWVTDRAKRIGDAEPDMPAGLNDRAEDAWEALVAVADLAGGTWPERVRKAAQVLSADAEEDAADSTRLLDDLRAVFAGAHFLYSATIAAKLAAIEGAPWSAWTWGKDGRGPINQRGLAELLKPYQVHPRDGREGGTGKSRKGYYAEELANLWSRYVPSDGGVRDIRDRATAGAPLPPRPAQTDVADDVADDVPEPRQAPDKQSPVADVADGEKPEATGGEHPDQHLFGSVADVADVADTLPNGRPERDSASLTLIRHRLGGAVIETIANSQAPGLCIAPGCPHGARNGCITCWEHAAKYEPLPSAAND